MKLLQMAEIALVMLEGRMHTVIKELQIPAVVISPALAKGHETKKILNLSKHKCSLSSDFLCLSNVIASDN